MKNIAICFLLLVSFGSFAFPKTATEAEAYQQTTDYQNQSDGYKADIDGLAGHKPIITTPHLDAPAIDRSSHLDGVHNQPIPMVELNAATVKAEIIQPATRVVKDTPLEQPVVGTDSVGNEKVISNNVGASEEQLVLLRNDIDANTRRVESVVGTQAASLAFQDKQSEQISGLQNSVNSNKSAIETNRRDIKRVGANAVAAANLHYNGVNSGYGLSVGNYRGETALAGGLQFNVSEHAAITTQVSYDGSGTGVAAGIHSDF